MAARVEWDGEAAKAAYLAMFRRKLHACGLIIQSRAKILLSVAGTGQMVRDQAAKGRPKGSSRLKRDKKTGRFLKRKP